MLRLMIGGLAAIAAGLVGGLAVMPVKASPRTVVVIAGPSLPLPGPVQSSSPAEVAPSAPKAVPAAPPRIHTADEPAPPVSAPAPAVSKKARSAPVAAARAKPRIRIARRDDDDDDDDRS
jgi:hypothetical protein